MIGPSVSRYEIIERLGAGGMGIVYKARDRKLDRFVALKFLAAHLTESFTARQRFQQEARAISTLNHPNIATIYEAGETEDGQQFLALEYLPGGTLRSRLHDLRAAGRKLSLADALDLSIAMLEGLAHAHRNGILHRDMKPANLIFTAEDAMKITDFGLAKFLDGPDITLSDVRLGTAAFMSPEQAQARPMDHRTDLFSAGAIVYEMLSGQHAFSGDTSSAITAKVVGERPEPLAQVRPETPERLRTVVEHALEKDPSDRYQTADEFLRDLRIVRGEFTSPLDTIPGTASLTASRPSRRKLLRWGVAAATLAAAITLAFVPALRPPFGRPVRSQKQIAVIPFENVNGGDPVNQAFCDGLVHTLTTALTELQQFHGSLMVVPASEVRRQGVTTPSEARKAFHVNLAITGSIQRMADQVRITTNLVDAQNGPQLGARTIVSRVQDMNELQDRVVRDVANLLDVELQKNATDLLAAGKTSSAGAYDLYLQARGYLERFDKPGNLDRAVKLLESALNKDARYALAWSALSQANWLQYRASKDSKWLELAQENGLRAIEIDARVPSAHVNLGQVLTDLGRYPEAVAECEAALKLDPVSVEAMRALAAAYERSGKISEAEDVYKKALQLREGDWLTWSYLGVFYENHGRHHDAEQPFLRVAALTPDNWVAYLNLGVLYTDMGRYTDARPQLERSINLKPSMNAYTTLATGYYFQGDWRNAVLLNEKALALVNPGRPAPHYVYGNLADAYRWSPGLRPKSLEFYRLAIGAADRALATNARDAFALGSRGLYRARSGDVEAGLRDAQAARDAAPGDMRAIYAWAVVQEIAHHRDNALAGISQALKAGYSIIEVQREPELSNLRRDPRFARILGSGEVH